MLTSRVMPHPHVTNRVRVDGWPPPVHPPPLAGGGFPNAAETGPTCGWEGGFRVAKVQKLVVSHWYSMSIFYKHTFVGHSFWGCNVYVPV